MRLEEVGVAAVDVPLSEDVDVASEVAVADGVVL